MPLNSKLISSKHVGKVTLSQIIVTVNKNQWDLNHRILITRRKGTNHNVREDIQLRVKEWFLSKSNIWFLIKRAAHLVNKHLTLSILINALMPKINTVLKTDHMWTKTIVSNKKTKKTLVKFITKTCWISCIVPSLVSINPYQQSAEMWLQSKLSNTMRKQEGFLNTTFTPTKVKMPIVTLRWCLEAGLPLWRKNVHQKVAVPNQPRDTSIAPNAELSQTIEIRTIWVFHLQISAIMVVGGLRIWVVWLAHQ